MNKEKVFPDVFTKRELNGLRLHCANPGCSWESTYETLEEHVHSSCEGAPVTCKHCGESVLRKDIKRHEKELCKARPVTCDFQAIGCNHDETIKLSQLSHHMEEGLKNHVWLLLQYILAFVTQLSNYIPRPEFTETMQKIRDDITDIRSGLAEKFVMLVGKLTSLERRIDTLESSGGGDEVSNLREHNMTLERELRELRDKMSDIERSQRRMEQSLAQHTDMGSQTDHTHFQRREFTDAMHNNRHEMDARLTALGRQIETSDAMRTADVNELRRDVEDLTAENNNLREHNMSLERELRELREFTEAMHNNRHEMDARLPAPGRQIEMSDAIVSLERQVQNIGLITGSRPQCTEDRELEIDSPFRHDIHSYNGTLVWKIESYLRKRQEAINGVRTALYSPPFYSARYGYKMCAKIYMNGDGIGQGSHLSLFLVVMRGDYDALQTWPFEKRITFMLFNQDNGHNMIDAFDSNPQNSSFQRPRSEMNIASGCPLFMPLDSLNNRQYIKDDVIFIAVIIN